MKITLHQMIELEINIKSLWANNESMRLHLVLSQELNQMEIRPNTFWLSSFFLYYILFYLNFKGHFLSRGTIIYSTHTHTTDVRTRTQVLARGSKYWWVLCLKEEKFFMCWLVVRICYLVREPNLTNPPTTHASPRIWSQERTARTIDNGCSTV